jgi:hypothetical protein
VKLANAQKDVSDVFVAGQAVRALTLAKRLGVDAPVNALAAAEAFLQNRFRAAPERDYERKLAILLASFFSGLVGYIILKLSSKN